MIKRSVTVKLQGSRAVVDSPIYLYQYDKNICLVITLLNNRYDYDKDTKLSFTLIKPDGSTVESALSAIIKDKYYISLTSDMLDGKEEVGQHLIQIRQHNGKGIVSLPPFAIHVLKSYVQPIPVEGVEDVLLTENEYMLLTENSRAIEVFGTVKISQLSSTTEVKGYIPVTQDDVTYKLDISNFATEEDLVHNHDSQYAPKEHNHDGVYSPQNHNHDTVYAKKEELVHNHDTQYAPLSHEHEQYLTEHQDLSNYATQTYVKNEIANAQLSGGGSGDIDLSGYVTKDEFNVHKHEGVYAPVKHSHDEYLTSVPSEYVTEEELDDKGYLTEHQSLSHLATKEELQNHKHDALYAPLTHEHEQYLTEHQSISHLATKSDLLNKSDKGHTHSYNELGNLPTIPSIDGLASIEYVDNAIAGVSGTDTSNFVTKEELQGEVETLEGSITTLGNSVSTLESGLSTKADEGHKHDDDYAPKEHTHEQYLTEHQDISHLVTKDEFSGVVISTTITHIELVDELPSEQVQGVLYIVKASE